MLGNKLFLPLYFVKITGRCQFSLFANNVSFNNDFWVWIVYSRFPRSYLLQIRQQDNGEFIFTSIRSGKENSASHYTFTFQSKILLSTYMRLTWSGFFEGFLWLATLILFLLAIHRNNTQAYCLLDMCWHWSCFCCLYKQPCHNDTEFNL